MKNSIASKIRRMMIASISILSSVMLTNNLIIIIRNSQLDNTVIMESICNAKVQELNNQFHIVEQSVQNLYNFYKSNSPTLAQLKTHSSSTLLKKFKDVAVQTAADTKGAVSIYFRINPEIQADDKDGFFCVLDSQTKTFTDFERTNILAYDENDVEHVGWFYIPKQTGKPMWLEPYYNANIDLHMISYTMPVYNNNTFVGILGMDVDFQQIIKKAENYNRYKSGGAALASIHTKKLYYYQCDDLGNQIPEDMFELLTDTQNTDKLINYKFGTSFLCLYYKLMENNMRLIIFADYSELIKPAYVYAGSTITIFIIGILFILTLIIKMTRKITEPIQRISEATNQYAQGNWDTTISCNTNDELQTLTENITVMATKTKQYIEYIKDKARKDGLTGLKNQTAYMMYIDTIQMEYLPSGRPFAIVIMDVNNLKYVNDNYGHEKGDELIVAAAKIICTHYEHSPIFRIGGDEFVAILDGSDYPERNELLESFRTKMNQTDKNDPLKIKIASGMAVFGEDGDTFEALFDLADQLMYKNKMELKEGSDFFKRN